jgi:hypothetical protein
LRVAPLCSLRILQSGKGVLSLKEMNWLLLAPQYHALILVLVLVALGLLIRINGKLK